MRACTLFFLAAGLTIIADGYVVRADPIKNAQAARIPGLIKQLGHKDFARREAASKQLDALAGQALDALRKATKDEDPEIRRRSERLVRDITTRMAEARAAQVPLESAVFATDLPLAESKHAIRRVSLRCRLANGGSGTLTLDPNAGRFDEFGDPMPARQPLPLVTLECTLKLIKKQKGRQLYDIRGPKIVSRLSLVAYDDLTPWGDGRLLVHSKEGDVKYVIGLERPQIRTKPCHPGCFPAGTKVRVPGGMKPMERLRAGELVTTVDAAGKPTSVKITGVFVTRNRLVKVRTKGGTLLTTETQPIALGGGGFRPAGELKPGDRIYRWTGARPQAAIVLDVSAADQEAQVFNIVLGDPRTFIAGDFLVRSKPPAAEGRPGRMEAETRP